MPELISFKGSEIIVDGNVLKPDAASIVNLNLAEWIDDLADLGVGYVKAGVKTKHGTGFTAAGVEKFHVRPLFVKIRMAPGLSRSPGSPAWPADRRPYVVNAVLASGVWRGERSSVRRKLDHFARAAYRLRARAKNIPEARLLRGL